MGRGGEAGERGFAGQLLSSVFLAICFSNWQKFIVFLVSNHQISENPKFLFKICQILY